jgi:hypothetical protein
MIGHIGNCKYYKNGNKNGIPQFKNKYHAAGGHPTFDFGNIDENILDYKLGKS